VYNSVHHYDIMVLSETMLDKSIKNEDIFIQGFNREIFRSDHPSNTKTGGVCVYFREGLPIKRRDDLEMLQEAVVAEINFLRKKILFVAIYRTPSQNNEQFKIFMDKLQIMCGNFQRERPYSIIVTGDFNCRSSQWWGGDIENQEGAALDELLETNNLFQLIDEPTNVRGECMSCIDLIITDQPNIFVESGVHPSLDDHCQHQIVYGKVNISIHHPPPYKRTIWNYSKANTSLIRELISDIDWQSRFAGLGVNEMTELFTDTIFAILSANIPNKVIKCNDKDPPWITPELKTAIKRKHRVFRKYKDRGRRLEDWNLVKEVRNKTSRLITKAKENYFSTMGRKLSDPAQGIKAYWAILNRLINKKKTLNIPPLLENEIFVTNLQTKADILNEHFVQQCSTIVNSSTLPNYQPTSDTLCSFLLFGSNNLNLVENRIIIEATISFINATKRFD